MSCGLVSQDPGAYALKKATHLLNSTVLQLLQAELI